MGLKLDSIRPPLSVSKDFGVQGFGLGIRIEGLGLGFWFKDLDLGVGIWVKDLGIGGLGRRISVWGCIRPTPSVNMDFNSKGFEFRV